MLLKGIIYEDFSNYKKCSTTLIFPFCTFKCGQDICQNSALNKAKIYKIRIYDLVEKYKNNIYSEAIVCQGLEPFDSWEELYLLISYIRDNGIEDDIVIYTGYNEDEISDKIELLSKYKNIIIKFGRYIPNQNKHYDNILGVELASDNQYAKYIS